MSKRERKKQAKKLMANVCVASVLLSNISLTLPTTKIYAMETEQTQTETSGGSLSNTSPDTVTSPDSINEGTESVTQEEAQTVDTQPKADQTTEPAAETQPQAEQSTEPTVETQSQAEQTTESVEQNLPQAEQTAEPAAETVVETAEVDVNSLPQLLITEISPNSSGSDYYEYFEVYNNTDQPISLANYSFIYRYTDGSQEDKVIPIEPVTLQSQETKVFWWNTNDLTVADFNQHFKTTLASEQIVEFKEGFSGFANGGNRALILKDLQGNEVISADYLPNETDNAGLVTQYKYPATGNVMDKLSILAAPTPGNLEESQVPATPVTVDPAPSDTAAPEIAHSPISVGQALTGIKVEAVITDDMAVPFATLYYKGAGEETFTSVQMNANPDTPSTYAAEIPGSAVKGDIVYYIAATDGVNTEKTTENTISVEMLTETSSDVPLLITEISPNSKGGGTDYYEYFELYNNTNKPMNLTNYSFVYRYTDSDTPDKVFQVPPVTLEPQETKVFWFNKWDLPIEDFNQNYGLSLPSEKVVIFDDIVFPGFANGGHRALVINDTAGNEVVSASYLGEENDNDGNLIEYMFPASGTVMEKYRVKTVPTPATIEQLQVPTNPIDLDEAPKDVEPPAISHTAVAETDPFTAITIKADVTDNMAIPFVTLFYKKAGDESFTSVSMNASGDPGSYAAEIPGSAVDSDITYYIEATDGTNSAKTPEQVITVKQPDVDYNKVPQFLVTEIVPDTSNVGSADGYEFIEIYNNSDKDINFKDYKLQYRYGEDPTTDVIWSSVPDDVVIPSKETLVFWIINAQNGEKTVADFNANYGTNLVENEDIVKVYSDGMANGSMRGLVVATNTKKELAVSYYFDEANVDDTNPNKGILYKYPVDGSTKSLKVSPGLTDASPGAVEAFQVPSTPVHIEDDAVAPSVEDVTGLTEINQKENLEIVADAADDKEVKSVRLFYRMNGQTDYSEVILQENFDDMMYHHTIYSPDIIGKKYVEYYYVVSDGFTEVTSDTYKISITSDLDDSSLRLNVKDGDIVNGEKIVKGTSKEDLPDQVSLFIDGNEVSENTYSSVESTAYFAFEVTGINTFFQNGVTMGEDILTIFDDPINDWDTLTVPVHPDRLQLGENIITVRAGNKASPFQLDESEENRDDFNIRNARLVLPDGTVIVDPAHSDPAKSYDMGDDGTYRPFEDFTFTIEEEFAPSKTYKWDTTAFADGEHTIQAKDADEEVTSTIFVDNTAPEISTNMEEKDYKGPFTINVEAEDEIAGVESLQVQLDGQDIEVPFETASSQLAPGEHTLFIKATDKVGNVKEQTVAFSVVNENPNKPELVSPTDDSETPVDGDPVLKVKVSDPTEDELDVSFYQGYQYDAADKNMKAYSNATDMEPPAAMIPEGEEAFAAEDIAKVSELDQNYLTLNSNEQFPYHRFEVEVDPSVDENDLVELTWSGKSLEGRKVTMYAWNHMQAKWLPITFKIAGAEDFELNGNVAVNEYVKDGKINVIIQDEIPQTPDEYDYTYVWMSDTQYYAESYPYIFERQTNWIAENKEKLKIKYVFHTGDVVDEYDKEYQWNYADQYMKVLEANNVPYGVLAGNHDVDHKNDDYTEFSKWFGEDRFKDKPYYGESYKDNRGHYDLISSNGNDFIMVYMGWGIKDEDLKWMDEVLKKYPNRKAILNFHEYLLVSGNRSPLGNRIYNEVVLPNENVVAVLSGHYHDSETLIDPVDDNGDGTADRQVYQMLGDYQGGPEGGQGYMKLLHFDQDNNRIIVNTYSPYLDDYNFYDPADFPGKDEMVINLDLSVDEKQVATDYFAVNIYTDTKIGEQEQVASGDTAEAEWEGLTENETYSWYAVAEDQYTGKAVSDIWSFTKGKAAEPNQPDPGTNPDPGNEPGHEAEPPANNGNQPSGSNNDSHQKPIGRGLPNTATNAYNWIILGMLAIMSGGAVWFGRANKRRQEE
jgi:Calcineurin-like phosphoesterase/Lamin Tail Domain